MTHRLPRTCFPAQEQVPGILGIRVLQLNMRYSSFGLTLLQQFLATSSHDVLLLQDPPAAIISGKIPLPGYALILSPGPVNDPPTQSARPLAAILLRSTFIYQHLPATHRRFCGVLISTQRGKIALISAYLHHTDGSGLTELQSLVTSTRQHTSYILVGLDSNGHSNWWGPPETITNAVGTLVEDFILHNRLVVANQLPCSPTFHSDQGFQSWIDITLSTPALSSHISHWRVLDDVPLDSDHSPLTFMINLKPACTEDIRLDWRRVDWGTFRITLQDTLEHNFHSSRMLDSPQSIVDFVADLTSALQEVIDVHVPKKRVCRLSHAWWSPHLASLRAEHLRARRHWKRTNNHQDKRHANACKRALQRAIIEAKRNSWRHFCETTSPLDMWSTLQKVSRPFLPPSCGVLQHDGVRYHADDDQARLFAAQFFPPNDHRHTDFHQKIESEVSAIFDHPPSFFFQSVTSQEIHTAIHSSGPWKASGIDRITNICLQKCEDLLMPFLTQLFNASLRLGFIPPSWKEAIVVAVPKPGRDPLSPASYRPISLLSVLGKILERIITNRLTFSLESRHRLAPSQFGFRLGLSTEDALWKLVIAASSALQTRHRLVLVSLDIQGAYDTVWHTGLLHKLAEMGISFDLLRWIRAFLTSRVANVRVRSAMAPCALDMGIPQGSPLSAILFLVYINDLLLLLQDIPGASAQGFADDLSSWWLENLQSSSSPISLHISHTVQTWADQWKMVFNPHKCKLLSIGRIRATPPSFLLNGVALQCVPHLRYLGVWLDSSLSWKEHIRQVSQRALNRLRLIHRTAGTLWGLHPSIFRHLVDAVVLPTLFYAAPIWCTAVRHLSSLAPLDRVIRHCAIATFGLLHTVSHEASQMMAGFLSADLTIRQRLLEFYLRRLTYGEDLLSMDTPSSLNQTPSPVDILRLETRQFTTASNVSINQLQQVEQHRLWFLDPSTSRAIFTSSILDREAAIERIRVSRLHSSPNELWVFTDGSVDGRSCGAAALFFIGSDPLPRTFAIHFTGHHSSTQAELVALRLGCHHARDMGHFQVITFVSDSQAALLSLSSPHRCLSLTADVLTLLHELSTSETEIRLWWTPGHSSVLENDLADHAAKEAAQSVGLRTPTEAIPLCRSRLRSLIRRHYITRLETQWQLTDMGSALRDIMPHFSRSLRWTQGLNRRQVALTAQFLTGHYATNAYLHWFGSRSDPTCTWCSAPVDDRPHRLFHCPRFSLLRQHSSMVVEADTNGSQTWSWEFLVTSGRRYLARFLDRVKLSSG